MSKNIQRPNWDSFPKTVGEMTPKQFFNLVRVAVQYEAQESSTYEAPGWSGAISGSVASLLSSPEDEAPDRNTVYAQTGNILYTVLKDNGLIDEEAPATSEAPSK